MNADQPRRGDFEERLLHELRALLVAQPSSGPEPLRRPRLWARAAHRPRHRLALAGGVAGLVAVAAAGVLFLTRGAAPAYAVNANDDGTVTVEINSLQDAAGLERKLRGAGIRAVVQYLPPGKTCKQPWFTPVSHDHGPGHEQATRRFEHTSDSHTSFTIGKHHPTDATLVIMAQGGGAGVDASSITVAYAQGDIGKCEIVDAPSES
jgi:hypothetical protein